MRLHQALDCQRTFTDVAAAARVPTASPVRSRLDRTMQKIPLKRLNKTIPFVYVCAIAHHLATPSQPAATIATQLVHTIQANSHAMDALESGVVIQATATGLIQFALGDRAIAAWLDLLLANALPPVPIAASESPLLLPAAAIFAVQYAHARCCSLLRLAHNEALMALEKLDEAPLYWRVTSPPSMPWLTATDQLCLNHPADRDLLGHLIEALDCLADDLPRRTQRALRSAQAIAQAMQVFHRVHPLWRKTGAEPTLVVSQLGLLLATQRILYLLLAHGLSLHPVAEL